MRTHRDLVGRVKQRAQARRIAQLGAVLLVNQRLGAPVRRHIQKLAILARPLARRAIRQTRQIVRHRQLAFVPGTQQAVGVPRPNPVNRRLDHVDATGLHGHFGLRIHLVLARLFQHVDLDAGRGGERREHRGRQCRIARPAHKVQLARRGQRFAGNQRRCRQCTNTSDRGFQKPAAAYVRCFRHVIVSLC